MRTTAGTDAGSIVQRAGNERGAALITALLVVMLASALLVGFSITVTSDQRVRAADRDRTQAFYAAQAGLEELTADLGALFSQTYRPTGVQVEALEQSPPVLPGIYYSGSALEAGYSITTPVDASGNPVASVRAISSGPFQGLNGMVTPYQLSVTARTLNGSEARVTRSIQTVGIPAFQFGMFSEVDLSFHAGNNFDFGGRVHTNANLYLAHGGGKLTMGDRVTAVGEVVRTHLANGMTTNGNWDAQVEVLTSPGAFRDLDMDEGSLVGTIGSAINDPTWYNLSTGAYNGNIRNGRTGARAIQLGIVRDGATPIDLIRRPNPLAPDPQTILDQRYFRTASLRILLSDTAADITALQGIQGSAPVDLSTLVPLAGGYTGPVIARAGNAAAGYRVPNGTVLVRGFLKVEAQRPDRTWRDVTLEILNRGIAGRNISNGTLNTPDTNTCVNKELYPNAVIRLQRVKDVPATLPPCGVTPLGLPGILPGTDFWPNVLYDTREGNFRDDQDQAETDVFLGGVMHFVELDVRNLSTWLTAQGANILTENGYVVYFSDRRTNRDAANRETGEYGFEDIVNPASAAGTPNNALDTGEDFNGNGTLQTYGQTPRLPAGAVAPYTAAVRPWMAITPAEARVNMPVFFRRALKVVNGLRGNIALPGLSIVAENPVYLQGDYNANATEINTFDLPHASTAIIADAVTLLSNTWNDIRSFTDPHDPDGRDAGVTRYRVALVAGKGIAFPKPAGAAYPDDFGSDGGVHNFLRYLEAWKGRDLDYRGSLISLFYTRQGLGVYKCCSNVYGVPKRNYIFDIDFLNINLLPPQTPTFRDLNTLGFSSVITPR